MAASVSSFMSEKALQEKLWNVAAPLYLKQSDLASAAAKQVRDSSDMSEVFLWPVSWLLRLQALVELVRTRPV